MDLFILAQQAGDNLDFAGQTTMHPVGASVLLIGLIAAFLLPRRYAIVPLIVALAFVPSAQRIAVFGLDFNIARLMVLGLLVRVTLRGEWRGLKLCAADYLLLAWAVWAVLAYTMLLGDFGAFVTRSGYMVEAVGGYLVGRACVRDFAAVRRLLVFVCVIAAASVPFFLIERASGTNMFSVFGGVPEQTLVRDDRLRCQGPFSHPIMAGVFWASVLPLLAALWFVAPLSRPLVVVGGVSALIIVANTASSTPVMAVLLGGALFAFYLLRSSAPLVRWAILLAIPFLHFSMTHGVHHLLARVNVVGGSTGWHRYHLMDAAMNNFQEWMLFGTVSTRHWGYGLQDVTNQYVLEGVRGGFLALALFMAWLICVFFCVSRELRAEKKGARCLVLWSFGVVLFVHCVNFIAVSYFGQVTAAFFLMTGMTVSLCNPAHRTAGAVSRQQIPRGGSRSAEAHSRPLSTKPMGPLHA